LRPCAHRDAETRYLGKPSGEKGRLGVVTGARAVDDSGGDGDDILAGGR